MICRPPSDLQTTVRGLALKGVAIKGVAIVKGIGPAGWNPQMRVTEVDDSDGDRIVIAGR
jgi:hypothetical protein